MVSRSNSSRLVAVLAWLVAMGVRLAAQAPAPTTPLRLSFADAVRLASGEVPVVALASLRTTEADARVRQARAALLPSLSLGGAWVNRDFNSEALGIPFPPQFNLPNPVPPFDNYDGRVTVTQTLFDWSSVARVRAAGAQADGSRAERGVTVEGAALTAALAYLRAARGQAAVAARQAAGPRRGARPRGGGAAQPDCDSRGATPPCRRRSGLRREWPDRSERPQHAPGGPASDPTHPRRLPPRGAGGRAGRGGARVAGARERPAMADRRRGGRRAARSAVGAGAAGGRG